ncbi:hypothetical protein ACFQ1M_12580 [Sungkyunkwania multivorans]|uniref:Uncharacterized protein n=1 Tax=Sungkyunkwania multivorans TaxID=1173618 RepID=A0ABW3D2J0_9FLAO
MKNLLLALPFIFLYLNSDNTTSFKIKDDQLVWQKVYQEGIDLHRMASVLLTQPDTKEAYVKNGVLFFKKEFDNTKDLSPLGYSKIEYPSYLGFGGIYWGNIQKREGVYKVTIDEVHLIEDEKGVLTENLESLIAKKGALKQNKRTMKVLSLLDEYFLTKFVLTKHKP